MTDFNLFRRGTPWIILAYLAALFAGCAPAAQVQPPPEPEAVVTHTARPTLTEASQPTASLPPATHTPSPTISFTPTPSLTFTPTFTPSPEPPWLPAINQLPYISLTNVEQLERLSRLALPGSGGFALSRDNHWLIVAGESRLRLFNLFEGKELEPLPGPPGQFGAGLVFHPTTLRLAAIDRPNHLRAWTLTIKDGTLQPAQAFRYEDPELDSLSQLVFTPNGSRLLGLGSQTGQSLIIIWDAASGQILLRAPADRETDTLLISPNGYLAVQAVRGGILRFWEPASGRSLGQQIIYACPDSLVGAAFAPDSQLLALQCDGDLSRIYLERPDFFRPDNLTLIRTLDTGTSGPGLLAFNRDGAMLAAAAGLPSRQVVLWNLIQKAPIRLLEGFSSPIQRLSFSADGRLLMIQMQDGTLEFWGAGS